MFGFGKKISELDQLIESIEMNMENNYKDNATSGFKDLREAYLRLDREKKLSDKQKTYYEPILTNLSKRLEGFTHKEQKAFWYVKEVTVEK